MTAEASRGPKRKAAHTRNGTHKNVQGSFRISAWKIGPKMMPAVKSVEKNKTDNSRSCFPDQCSGAFEVHSSRNGVKMRAPAVSPSHQVRQISPYWLHVANPPSVRLVTPNVAATAVLRIPPKNANRRMSLVQSDRKS